MQKSCGACSSSAFVKGHRPGYCCHKSVDRSAVYRSTKGCSHFTLIGIDAERVGMEKHRGKMVISSL